MSATRLCLIAAAVVTVVSSAAPVNAQQAAMGALNLPSASEVDRLERRLRSLSQRLEAVEEQMDGVARDVAAIRRELAGQTEVAADQARLDVHAADKT